MNKEEFNIDLIKILKIKASDEFDEEKQVDYDSLQALEIAVCFDKHLGVQPSMTEILNCKSLKMFMLLAEKK